MRRSILSRPVSLAFISPAAILILLFLVYPFVSIFFVSFTNQSLVGVNARNPAFVGFANYADLFDTANWFARGEFGNSLVVTTQYVIGSALIGQACLGMALAVIFYRRKGIFKETVTTLAIAAWIIPEVVVGFAWFAFLDPFEGTLNNILGFLGLVQPDWLLEYPVLSIIFFNTWRGTAFSMLLFTSALASIPPSHIETAEVIGASTWQKFRDILLPQIKGAIATDIILITLWTFNTFSPYLLTGGGPSYRSEVVSIFTYRTGLQNFEFGKGSAVAVMVMLINLALASTYLFITRVKKGTAK